MYHTFPLISICNLSVFNMTMVNIPTKMSDMFDGSSDSCINISDITSYRSYIKTSRVDNYSGNVIFDVKVHGVTSCLNYEFLFVLVKNELCDFVRSCNVTHDLATSNNSCIVHCPCEDNCDIVLVIYSLITYTVGSVCEMTLL